MDMTTKIEIHIIKKLCHNVLIYIALKGTVVSDNITQINKEAHHIAAKNRNDTDRTNI